MTAFDDLESYIALPRLSGLLLSPDGTRLVTAAQTLDPKSTKYVTALWEVDPAGVAPARRLTRSAKGEGGAAFLPSGDLLFTSGRPDPESKDGDDEVPDLWLLPSGGGEARVVGHRKAGVGDLAVAKDAPGMQVSGASSVQMPGGITALEFTSTSAAWGGPSRELWFAHDGKRYQVSTPLADAKLLDFVRDSWQWRK